MRTRELCTTAITVVVAGMLLAAPVAGAKGGLNKDTRRLAAVVNEFSSKLGVKRDATGAIRRARLPRQVAHDLTGLLSTLRRCHGITRRAFPTVEQLLPHRPGGGPPPATEPDLGFQDDVINCGRAATASANTLSTLSGAMARARKARLDLWPVLRYEPGAGDTTYTTDYVLIVDRAGNDSYFNNAGGNALDIVRHKTPARGCIDAFDIIRPATCVLSAAAVIDLAGNDTYGRLDPPDPDTDGLCTSGSVQRRIFTGGAGVAGVGILIDRRGDDRYTGKVITMGAGHIGGYGLLRDEAGNDSYAIVRTGLGAAIVGGLGELIDGGGNDRFDFYVPAPLNPLAPNLTPGAGGVRDDLDRCNRDVSLTLGAGSIGGVGQFSATGGDDFYRAPLFSLGSGDRGGAGRFSDLGGGNDTSTGDGAFGRANNVALPPTPFNQGTFEDR
jgi:hypothetical protein